MPKISKTKLHKTFGVILFIPFILWTVTGIIFFIKPGYGLAYEQLQIKTYPMPDSVNVTLVNNAFEQRVIKSILGYHLLVKSETSHLHLHLQNKEIYELPDSTTLKLLVDDAISSNRERYGKIIKVENNSFKTDKGINIILDWNSLSLYQEGADTRFINTLYKIHYLQWTGIKPIDNVLGIVGLLLVSALAIIGLMLLKNSKN